MEKLHLFRIALEVARDAGEELTTVGEVAGALDVSTQHLYYVLNEMRESPRVEAWLDGFIGDRLDRLTQHWSERRTQPLAA